MGDNDGQREENMRALNHIQDEPLHPQDDTEDWAEVVQWLRDNWESVPLHDRMALKRLLTRISAVNDEERRELALLEAEYSARRDALVKRFETRRERIRESFRKATS